MGNVQLVFEFGNVQCTITIGRWSKPPYLTDMYLVRLWWMVVSGLGLIRVLVIVGLCKLYSLHERGV